MGDEHMNRCLLDLGLNECFLPLPIEAGTSAVYFHVASQALQKVASMNRPFRKKSARSWAISFASCVSTPPPSPSKRGLSRQRRAPEAPQGAGGGPQKSPSRGGRRHGGAAGDRSGRGGRTALCHHHHPRYSNPTFVISRARIFSILSAC